MVWKEKDFEIQDKAKHLGQVLNLAEFPLKGFLYNFYVRNSTWVKTNQITCLDMLI